MRYHVWTSNSKDGIVWKGLVAGLVGGLAASFFMNQFQTLGSKVMEGLSSSVGEDEQPDESEGGNQQAEAEESNSGEQGEEQDPATVRAAAVIGEGFFGRELTKSEKNVAGPAMHYAFGTTVGSLYGMLAERASIVTAGAGLLFGTAVWLVADEGAVPALGLSKAPWKYPASTHLYALASHLVYGLTADTVRRIVRRVL